MFSQFQAQYPMGSLVSELLQIHDGNYVVRAVVQVGSVTIATGMAAAIAIDQAEDQARIRALAVLGIHPLDQTQPGDVLEATPTSVSPTPESLDTPSYEPEEPLAQTFNYDPEDWPTEEVRPSISSTTQSPPPATILPDTPKYRSQNGKVVTQASRASPQTGMHPKPIDLSDVIAQTSVELKRLNWSDAQGRGYLQRTYQKRSRQQLTDEELLEFLHYLQSQPSADEPSF